MCDSLGSRHALLRQLTSTTLRREVVFSSCWRSITAAPPPRLLSAGPGAQYKLFSVMAFPFNCLVVIEASVWTKMFFKKKIGLKIQLGAESPPADWFGSCSVKGSAVQNNLSDINWLYAAVLTCRMLFPFSLELASIQINYWGGSLK